MSNDQMHVLARLSGGESHRVRTAALDSVADVVSFERYQPNNNDQAYVVRVAGVRIGLAKAQLLPFVLGIMAARGESLDNHLQAVG